MSLNVLRMNGIEFHYKSVIIPEGTVIYVHKKDNFNEQESLITKALISEEEELIIAKSLCETIIKRNQVPVMPEKEKKEKEKTIDDVIKSFKDSEVNVLGSTYKIKFDSSKNDPDLEENDGYCCAYNSTIGINTNMFNTNNPIVARSFINKVIRHEIVHAFLFESGMNGLCEWAENETIVDWIAIQLPKLKTACKDFYE